ncbi:hypothetical protein, partial [Shigella sonnei]
QRSNRLKFVGSLRWVKERPWKYPTAPKKSQSVA